MAQDISSIINELNAGYDPQRQLINQQIQQLQPQADAQIQGINQQKDTAYRDINRAALDRGMFFSSIPSQDQSDYVQKTYVPAVAQVQTSLNNTKNSLLGSLNSINSDQYNRAYAIKQGQMDTEEKQREFDRQLAAQNAGNSSNALASLFGQQQTQQQPPAFAQQATNAMEGLFRTNNPQTIKSTIDAITASANKGNAYDQYKLQLLKQYQANSQYGSLITKALTYKPSQIAVGNAKQPTLSLGSAKQMTLR